MYHIEIEREEATGRWREQSHDQLRNFPSNSNIIKFAISKRMKQKVYVFNLSASLYLCTAFNIKQFHTDYVQIYKTRIASNEIF
jgi:hypothetical protein